MMMIVDLVHRHVDQVVVVAQVPACGQVGFGRARGLPCGRTTSRGGALEPHPWSLPRKRGREKREEAPVGQTFASEIENRFQKLKLVSDRKSKSRRRRKRGSLQKSGRLVVPPRESWR